MSNFVLTEEEMEPLLEGLAVFGTGGGGSPAFGRAIMENDFRRGRRYILVDPADISDDAFIVSGGIMGSVKAVDTASVEKIIQHWEAHFELLVALKTMETLSGRKVDYIVPIELGGLNTPVILSLGARAGIPVINGDSLGRAAPETQMSSFMGHGISIVPMPLVDDTGNVIIVRESQDIFFPDELGRWVITNAEGMGANTHYPMSGKELKLSVVPKTITKAFTVGKEILHLREEDNLAIIDTISRLLRGKILFRKGVVAKLREEDRGGFLYQIVSIREKGGEGRVAELIVKNEVMLCQVEGKEVCIFPDLTLMVDTNTGRGIMSSELREGLELSIILAPCHSRVREALRSPQGRLAFSPARFGYENLQYTPLEVLNPDFGG